MTAKLPDKTIQRVVSLRREGRSYRDIGTELGINAATAMRYAKEFMGAEASTPNRPGKIGPDSQVNVPIDNRGDTGGEVSIVTPDKPKTLDEMMELFKIDPAVWVPTIFRANEWQGYYKLPDGSGHRKVNLWQTRVAFKRIVAKDVEHAILEFVRQHVGPIPKRELVRHTIRRSDPRTPQMVSWGLWDAHVGLFAWRDEVRNDYDVNIAENRVLNSIDDMVEELRPYPIEKIIMPVGNDYLHFDNARHKTSTGDHLLDTDSRYGKVYLAGLRGLCYMVERALEITNEIEIIYVPGNHDLVTSYTLVVALAQRYRNEPRVKVDLNFNPRKYRKFGRTLLGFDHGQKCPAAKLALIMHEEARDLLDNVIYKEWQVGHTHQRKETRFMGVEPTNSVLVRTNPCLTNVDLWHYQQGFISEPVKSVEAWRYSKETGYVGSHVAWARDDRAGEKARKFLL